MQIVAYLMHYILNHILTDKKNVDKKLAKPIAQSLRII